MSNEDNRTIDRRWLLQTLGATTVASLAGCGGDGGDGTSDGGDGGGQQTPSDGGELGERVPTVNLSYLASFGIATKFHENAAPEIKKALEELGVDVEITPKGVSRAVKDTNNDARTENFILFVHGPSPDRLDPQEMTIRYVIDWAGANGKSNTPQYASCEYSTAAYAQSGAPTPERRQELVSEAHSVMSDDKAVIPILPQTISGVVRSDQVTANKVGQAGITRTNPWLYLSMDTSLDTVVTNVPPVNLETMNFLIQQGPQLVIWNNLPHTPLLMYDENLDLTEAMARTYEVSDDGRTITVELEDATFHNGDPVTASDVQFTYSFLRDNAEVFPKSTAIPYESIDAIDEGTVEFNLEEPQPAMITREFPKWGILHERTWTEGGAVDDPDGFSPNTLVGSGPFEVENFNSGRSLELTPHDGNPVASPDYDLFLQAYQDTTTAVQAFINDEIQVVVELTAGQIERIDGSRMADNATVSTVSAFMPYPMYPQCSFSPTKFSEFRDAVGTGIDRKLINDVAFGGTSDSEQALYSTIFMESHPFRPPPDQLHQFTDDPSGDLDRAKSTLREEDWGWDDDGRLHYPADADLSPLWPKGETPRPEDFPCINEDGQFVGSS